MLLKMDPYQYPLLTMDTGTTTFSVKGKTINKAPKGEIS